MNTQTPRKSSFKEITQFFSSQAKPSPPVTRSRKPPSPLSTSPTLKLPPQSQAEPSKRGHKRKTPSDPQSHPTTPPKVPKMADDRTPTTPDTETPVSDEHQAFLNKIGDLIVKQGESQKKQLEEHLNKNEEKFNKKMETVITKLDEKLTEKIQNSI